MEIYDNIEDFLSMENTGALMIVGAWGSGRMYYIDNEKYNELNNGIIEIEKQLSGFTSDALI